MNNMFFENEYKMPLSLYETISKTPRYYQANTANEIANLLYDGFRRILVKSPTGTGKTLISKLIALSERVRDAIGSADKKEIKILFIANKHRLNRQALEEYQENTSIKLIVHSAFSSIPQSIIDEGWDMTFIDEAHHEAMSSIQLLLDTLIEKPLIGFTAEENRGDGLLIKFERIVESISKKEATERGFIEKAGINTFIDTGYTDKSEITCQILDQYNTHMGNTIIFLRTEKEAKKVHKHLKRNLKLTTALLDSSSNEKDMDNALEKLSEGKIQFLVNCQKVGEGIDTPNVTDVLLCRHFNSMAEKVQYIGRAIRPDSPCAVWEFINPLKKNMVTASSLVGMTKYERLINLRRGQWEENLISGEDLTWGQMQTLRKQPKKKETVADLLSITSRVKLETLPNKGTIALSLKKSGIDTNINPADDLQRVITLRNIRKEKLLKLKGKNNTVMVRIKQKPKLVA